MIYETEQTPQITTIEEAITQIDKMGCWNCLEGGFCNCGLTVLQTPYVKLDRTHGIVLQLLCCIENHCLENVIQTCGTKLVISILDEEFLNNNFRYELQRDSSDWIGCRKQIHCESNRYSMVLSILLFVYKSLNNE